MNAWKRLTSLFLGLAMVAGLTACGGQEQPAEEPEETPDAVEETTDGFPFTLKTHMDMEVTFDRVPETVIACNPNAGDQLMALGLGDKIIATAYNNSRVAEPYREEYESKPKVADEYISLETILDLEPDFCYGRSSSFSEKRNTTHDTLSGYGIMSLSSIEGYTVGADIDVVYQDFYNLGRIFQVEDKAEEIVNGMKEKVAAIEEAVADEEVVKVLVYDMATEDGVYTCGDNFTSKLIAHAGGQNIFADMEKTWSSVSLEEIVERAPDVIVINDYGSIPLETKLAELRDNPALADVPAIANDNIMSIPLAECFACSMTADTVEKFAHAFHPNCF